MVRVAMAVRAAVVPVEEPAVLAGHPGRGTKIANPPALLVGMAVPVEPAVVVPAVMVALL